jgi:transcriptional regulator with XRE-family HTH domain
VPVTLGERIRAKRLERGWTQDELARRAGISKGFLSDLENNKRGVNADTLLDVAQALGVSIDYLMTGSEEERAAAERIEIPTTLGQFASEAGLSFRQTLLLLDMRRQIVAHRGPGEQQDNPEHFDWRRFHESVKDFL